MTLAAILRRYDRDLRKYCKEQLNQAKMNGSAVWVTDNYRSCSSALKAALGFLSREGEKDLKPLFFLCKDFMSSCGEITDSKITARFSGEKLSIFQCEALIPLLFASSAAIITENADSADEKKISLYIRNLFKLRETDSEFVLYGICAAERYLSGDPQGIYDNMSSDTRRLYRRALAKKAEKSGKGEGELASELLKKAKEKNVHIGELLNINDDKSVRGWLFIAGEWLLALLLSVLVSVILLHDPPFAVFLLLPVYQLIKPLGDLIAARLFSPYTMPSMDEEKLKNLDTLITVSVLLPSASKAQEMFSRLSELYSSNSSEGVKLLLLADMRNSKKPEEASDSADIAAVKRLIDRLNEKHGGGFSVAVRERVFSPTENEYTGYERKRGAISALIKYICDSNAEQFSFIYGDTKGLTGMKYIMALDSDTELSFEVIRSLVAAAEHPLNRPVFSADKKRIISGFGIIAPRVETSVASAEKTFFSRIFTDTVSASYSPVISERYMDMFGRSIFSGKGLINAAAFRDVICDKLDEQYILSHDILEGALLRTAFYPSSELTDSFPSSAEGYFSRLNRWIRGDVQNLRYTVFPLSKKESSPVMPPDGKYQLTDNFRRAVTPAVLMSLMICTCFMSYGSAVTVFLISLSSLLLPRLLPVAVSFCKNGPRVFSSLYFSSEIASVYKDIIRAFLDIGSLPQNAFTSLDAVIRSLYRSLVSKKRLLQWTTAEDADKVKRKNILYQGILPFAVALILFSFGFSYHRLVAVLILLFIPLALSNGIHLDNKDKRELSENEKQAITSFAAAAWRFFDENVISLENMLPPDNIQETPVPKRARRTSPTNIGFYLVSVLSACDLSFITPDEMLSRINATLDTVDKLPKYKGLLYNWYDTVRLTALKPEYVSTVDCGNYLVCLTALKQGLKEYYNILPETENTVSRIENILDASDLSFLYDSKRHLFRIGADAGTGKLSDSYYDLYMSEARMTSYYECAKRHVPVRHWQSLDRSLKRASAYITAVSWTGTMFEYFLPVMFLGCRENTFQYEALKVCLREQKRRAAKKGIPYGISESCFAAIDSAFNYRYKAHGLRSLALKRDADEESVISPYSTFLTLPFDKKSAMKNLSRLSALHCEGVYGFYEALDFTPERNDGEDYSVVRCYMSHHIGMSIVAMANALCDNIFVKRFMSDISMSSAGKLLEEKIPSASPVLKTPSDRKEKRTEGREKADKRSAEPEGKDVFAYSNGELSFFCDKYGRNKTVFAGAQLFKYCAVSEGISVGIDIDASIIPLFPSFDENTALKKYALTAKRSIGDIEITAAGMVHPSENALLIPVKVKNNGEMSKSITVHYYAEPFIFPLYESDRHPAFSDMFLKVDTDDKHKSITFYRCNKEELPAVAFGFYGKNKLMYGLDRERIIKRTGEKSSVFYRDYSCPENAPRGVFPALAMSTKITVLPSKSTETVFIAAPGIDRESAVFNLLSVRSKALPVITKGAAATFLRDELTTDAATKLIADSFLGKKADSLRLSAAATIKNGINSLWETGVSGDVPVITVFPEKNCPLSLQRAYLRLQKRLLKASVGTDLIFIFDGGPDYGFTGERDLRRLIAEENMNDLLFKKGGIHIFYRDLLSDESFAALLAFSSCIYPDNSETTAVRERRVPVFEKKTLPQGDSRFINGGYLINERPSVPWSFTLSNNTFGTLVTDRSLGYSWSGNSRQNKLTPWSNDTACDLTGERLYILSDDKLYDAAEDCAVYYSPSEIKHLSKLDGVISEVCTEVSEKGAKKRISITLKNLTDKKRDIELIYCVRPVLGESERFSDFVKITKTDKGIYAENPMNTDYHGVLYISSERENASFYENMKSFTGNDEKSLIILQKFVLEPNKEYKNRFFMCFASTGSAAEKLAEHPFKAKVGLSPSFNTPYPALNEFSSSLLYHQVSDTRLRARCGFYQCSGAFGFRDQLQDILPLIGRENRRVRQMIFTAAAAQFPEGDVLHWFHKLPGRNKGCKGIRTKCSDDMLWLPFAVYEYVTKSGDRAILDKLIPYRIGEPLGDDMTDSFAVFYLSKERSSLYEHCLRAIIRAYRTGEHGLTLIGSGDWNDSFDKVGIKGKGESVWLSMFLGRVARDFAKICESRKDYEIRDKLMNISERLFFSVDSVGFNGKWYIRGFYDDGSPLGDEGADSCSIDLLCQAWASLSGMPDKNRVKTALMSAYERLFDEKNGVVKLFAPPFGENSKKTGYVNLYPEGMRENGGQYTHAAVWFCTALFREGLIPQAERVLSALLPSVKHREGKGDIYKNEPYALSGDVYSAEFHNGRGGWSLYTGSAGWLLSLTKELDGK